MKIIVYLFLFIFALFFCEIILIIFIYYVFYKIIYILLKIFLKNTIKLIYHKNIYLIHIIIYLKILFLNLLLIKSFEQIICSNDKHPLNILLISVTLLVLK